jgi:nitroreductase
MTYQLDTGSAWENMAIEAPSRGFAIHGMAGFNYEKAKVELRIPDYFEVIMMIAIKVKDTPYKLPASLIERETPSSRKPITELIMEGKFQKTDNNII